MHEALAVEKLVTLERGDGRSQAALYWLAVVTALIGIMVALAPHLPSTLLSPLLVAGLLAWTVAAMVGLYILVKESLSTARTGHRRFDGLVAVLGLLGILLTVLACSQLWFVRIGWDRSALIWNTDWRVSLSHAHAIARYGDLSQALEYSGQPIEYHVGPGWIAGHFQRTFGAGIEHVLFGLLPALAAVSALGGMAMILLAMGVNLRRSIASVGLAAMVPSAQILPLQILRHPSNLLNGDHWSLGSGAMTNSSFGLAVGMSALVLIYSPRRHGWALPLGALSLAATVVLKPQYFAGLGLLVGMSGLAWMIRGRIAAAGSTFLARFPLPERWAISSAFLALAVLAVLPFVVPGDDPSLGLATSVIAYASILLVTLHFGVSPLRAGSGRSLAAATVALAVALGLFMVTPGHPAIFAGPTFAPGKTGWSTDAYASSAALLFVLSSAVALAPSRHSSDARTNRCLELGWLALLSVAVISVGLQVVSFPMRPELVEHALLLGMDRWGPTSGQAPLGEGLEPLFLLVATCAVASIVTGIGAARSFIKRAFVACASLAMLGFATFLLWPTYRPDRGYEAAEDAGLKTVLASVPVQGARIISSDIADPAQDYARPGIAPLLSAYAGHLTYVSELLWLNWVRPDAPTRLNDLRLFFGSYWSPWHESWLLQHGITHVLVHDRCIPRWWRHSGSGLVPISRSGRWTAFHFEIDRPIEDVIAPAEMSDMVPQFGAAECLKPVPRADPGPTARSGG